MKQEKQTINPILNIDIDQLVKHPNILIAASLWDKERFDAAKVCYRFMRRIDDLIDDHKATNNSIAECEKKAFTNEVNKWIECLTQKSKQDPFIEEVAEIIEKFRIPLHLFHSFARSMIYDIHNDGFPTYRAFIKYAEGASVAPASVFVHLCCLNKDYSNYVLPNMNLRQIARPCALFSYLVHIIRDFEKDYKENLNYFAKDLLEKYQLTDTALFDVAYGNSINGDFRDMIGEYCTYAEFHSRNTIKEIEKLSPFLEPKYLLSLKLIYQLYLFVFNRIDILHGSFSSKELNPTTEELKEQINLIISGNIV
jgi:phytoene synthase